MYEYTHQGITIGKLMANSYYTSDAPSMANEIKGGKHRDSDHQSDICFNAVLRDAINLSNVKFLWKFSSLQTIFPS